MKVNMILAVVWTTSRRQSEIWVRDYRLSVVVLACKALGPIITWSQSPGQAWIFQVLFQLLTFRLFSLLPPQRPLCVEGRLGRKKRVSEEQRKTAVFMGYPLACMTGASWGTRGEPTRQALPGHLLYPRPVEIRVRRSFTREAWGHEKGHRRARAETVDTRTNPLQIPCFCFSRVSTYSVPRRVNVSRFLAGG